MSLDKLTDEESEVLMKKYIPEIPLKLSQEAIDYGIKLEKEIMAVKLTPEEERIFDRMEKDIGFEKSLFIRRVLKGTKEMTEYREKYGDKKYDSGS